MREQEPQWLSALVSPAQAARSHPCPMNWPWAPLTLTLTLTVLAVLREPKKELAPHHRLAG